MKRLLIMRHAKSSWKDERLSDHERPLNKRGKRDAPRMGRLLRDLELVPDLIISSTARRAMDTAAAVAEASGYDEAIMISRYMYHGDPEAYLEVLAALNEEPRATMVVGHNPGLEELVEELLDRYVRLPTATVVAMDVSAGSWREVTIQSQARLVGIWRPKELDS
ncbi:MAG: histidine phosphatase family protein [Candidatus Promineifilaceae bacterium]|nr:histidine phosphatase family protein [Candidatus Promineifilaceae bacterium]